MQIEVILLVFGLLVVAGLATLIFMVARSGKKPAAPDQSMLMMQEQIKQLTDRLDDRLDKSQEQMRAAMNQQFGASSRLISEVTQSLTKLQEGNQRVVSVADELKTLQNVLQNPKQRGGIGEFYLDSVIGNVLPTGNYELQYKFKNGDIVDAVIRLDKGKLLPVDSKFSLENYNRLVEERDKTKQEMYVRLFKQDLKNRIDETSKYIRPDEGTMDFAFMFIPSEAIYYDLLVNKVGAVKTSAQDLIEYAFRDKRVVIVSPTSFLAYLQTVLQGLRSLQIEEQAKEIQARVGMLGRHLKTYDEYMQKLGKTLGTTVGHYNNAHKELGKIDKDVVKIAGVTPAVEPLLLDKPTQEED